MTPKKRRSFLLTQGYPKGFSIVVQSSNGYILGDTLVVEAVVEMLKKIGVDAQPRVLEIARRAEMLGKRQVTGLVLANPWQHAFRHRRDRMATAAPGSSCGLVLAAWPEGH